MLFKNLNGKKYITRNTNKYLNELHNIKSEYEYKDTFF